MTNVERKQISHIDTLRNIVTSPGFEKSKAQTGRLDWAVAHAALALAEQETSPSGYRTPEGDRLHIVATVDRYLSAERIASQGDLLAEEKDSVKEDLIAFNHALTDLINNDPSATPTEILAFLDGLYSQLHSRDPHADAGTAHNRFIDRLRGVMSEMAGEQLLCYLGYDVDDDISIEDDRCGVDRYAFIGDQWYGIDFKSSPASAIKARQDYPYNVILCPRVPFGEYQNGFHLSDEQLEEYAPAFERELDTELRRHQKR